jgi:hypothetical protein
MGITSLTALLIFQHETKASTSKSLGCARIGNKAP